MDITGTTDGMCRTCYDISHTEYQRNRYRRDRTTILATARGRRIIEKEELEIISGERPDLVGAFIELPNDPLLKDYCRYVLRYAYN